MTNEYGPKVKASALVSRLTAFMNAGEPTMVWGGPGIAKTEIHHQIADSLGLPLVAWHLNMWDSVDGRGVPFVTGTGNKRTTSWAAPDIIPTQKCVLFLDEMNTAPPSVQVTMQRLVLERSLGGVPLPDGTIICAAGNRASDRGATYPLPIPLRNRFAHFELEPDVDDWATWALTNSIDPVCVAFLRFRPELLYQFSKDAQAFPTPRSWAKLFRTLDRCGATNGTAHDLAFSVVGEGAAIELTAWLSIVANMPSVDNILLNPTAAPVPQDPGTLYALAGALARRLDGATIPAVMTYIKRIPREFGVATVKDGLLRNPKLQTTREFITWATDFSAFMNAK